MKKHILLIYLMTGAPSFVVLQQTSHLLLESSPRHIKSHTNGVANDHVNSLLVLSLSLLIHSYNCHEKSTNT